MANARSVVVVKRAVAARPSRVFAAWCRPELMAQWFFPAPGWRAEVTADVRVGGRYRVAMHDPDGGVHVQEGAYRAIEPEARLVFTWTCEELGVADSLVTVELRDAGAKTELTISHELPDDAAILREHEGGWKGCLESLARYLEHLNEGGPAMNSIKEKIIVRGSTEKLFDALTSTAGYNGWWSKDCQIAEKPGGESKLKFNKDGTIVSMRFRVDEVVPKKAVRWTCVAHDMESWIGTTLNWRLAADGDVTEVSFEHGGWKGDAPEPVIQGWRHFVGSLRSFVETGKGEPW